METFRDRIYNPLQKDWVTFLRTADETQGELTLLEVELAPFGGNAPHYHRTYSEAFTTLEGELSVQVGEDHHVLKHGMSALVPPGTSHRFYNQSDAPTRFLVELRPGQPGFETALRIGYGLATDGKTTRAGLPKNPLALGYLAHIAGMTLGGPVARRLVPPVSALLAWLAVRTGVARRLEATYATPAPVKQARRTTGEQAVAQQAAV